MIVRLSSGFCGILPDRVEEILVDRIYYRFWLRRVLVVSRFETREIP